MNKKARKKILSLLLTLCLIMGMVPMTAWAEGEAHEDETPLGLSITAFASLEESLATQYWEPGTTQDKFSLPSSLTATAIDSEAV